MSRETKNTAKMIVVIMLLGIILLSVFSHGDTSAFAPENTDKWLRATQILFGF